MTPERYRDAIKALGFTQVDFAAVLGAKPRTGQYWANVSVPGPVAVLVRLLEERPELRPVVERIGAEEAERED